MDRRVWLGWIGAQLLTARSGAQTVERPERRIELQLSRYAFSAVRIEAHRGESITFMLTATDFVHGFSLPRLQVRADVAPGRPVALAMGPVPAGRYTFLCDNFCGEGHDGMTGVLVVNER